MSSFLNLGTNADTVTGEIRSGLTLVGQITTTSYNILTDFSIATDKFTVSSSTGSTTQTGDLTQSDATFTSNRAHVIKGGTSNGTGPYVQFLRGNATGVGAIGSTSAWIGGASSSSNMSYGASTGNGHDWFVNGSTTYGMKLDVNSNLTISSTFAILNLRRSNSTTAYGAINFNGSDDTVDWQISTNNIVGGAFEINEGSGVNSRLSIASGGVVTIPGQTNIGADISIGYPKTLAITAGATTAAIVAKTTTTNYPIMTAWNSSDSSDNIWIYWVEGSGGTSRGSIDYNRGGAVVRYNTSSDMTMKTLIGDAPLQKSKDIIMGIRLREFYWNHDETQRPQIGPFAQELYETFPGAVSVGGDYVVTDEQGNEVTKYKPWAVDKTAPVFHLVAVAQDHEAQIAKVRSDMDAKIAQLQYEFDIYRTLHP